MSKIPKSRDKIILFRNQKPKLLLGFVSFWNLPSDFWSADPEFWECLPLSSIPVLHTAGLGVPTGCCSPAEHIWCYKCHFHTFHTEVKGLTQPGGPVAQSWMFPCCFPLWTWSFRDQISHFTDSSNNICFLWRPRWGNTTSCLPERPKGKLLKKSKSLFSICCRMSMWAWFVSSLARPCTGPLRAPAEFCNSAWGRENSGKDD